MHLRRSTLTAAAVTAILLTGGVAYASDDPVLQVDAKVECGRVVLDARVTKSFAQTGADTYEIAVFAGSNAGGASDLLGQFTVAAGDPVSKVFTLDEDSYNGDAFVSWATVSGPNPEFFVRGVVSVGTDCSPNEQPGGEPSEEPGGEQGEQPGDEPGQEPGDEPGQEPGDEPGGEPGDEQGSEPEDTTGGDGEDRGDTGSNDGEPADEPGSSPAPIVEGFSQTGVVPVGAIETGRA